MSIENYRIVNDISSIDFDQVNSLLTSCGLSDLDSRTQRQVFENSYAATFLVDGDKVIGVGRVISDGISQAAIYNIALLEKYRGSGLGKVIVDDLLDKVRGCNVILYTHPKYIGLYEHWGFSRLKTGYARFNDSHRFEISGFIDPL